MESSGRSSALAVFCLVLLMVTFQVHETEGMCIIQECPHTQCKPRGKGVKGFMKYVFECGTTCSAYCLPAYGGGRYISFLEKPAPVPAYTVSSRKVGAPKASPKS